MKSRLSLALIFILSLLLLLSACSAEDGNASTDEGHLSPQRNSTAQAYHLTNLREIFGDFPEFTSMRAYGDGFFAYIPPEPEGQEFSFYYFDLGSGSRHDFRLPLPEGFHFANMYITSTGDIWILETTREYIDANGNVTEDLSRAVHAIDSFALWQEKDGVLAPFVQGAPNTTIFDLVFDIEGQHFFTHNITMDGDSISRYSMEGELISEIQAQGIINSIAFSEKEGTLIIAQQNHNESTLGIYSANWDTANFDFLYEMEHFFCTPTLYSSNKYSFVLSDGSSMFGVDIPSNQIYPLISWGEYGLLGVIGTRGTLMLREDGHIVLDRNWMTGVTRILQFTKTEPYQGEITNIRLSNVGNTFSLPLLEEAIMRFRQTHPQYRIEVIDYFTEIGVERLLLDIFTGNMPDIIELSKPAPWLDAPPLQQMIIQGVLADLSPFIERDLNMSDYFKASFSSQDESIYFLVPAFTMEALLGRDAVISALDGQTMEEILHFLRADAQNGQAQFKTSMTEMELLTHILFSQLETWIDFDTNQALFDTEAFQSLLYFLKEYTPQDAGIPPAIHMTRDAQDIAFVEIDNLFTLNQYFDALEGDLSISGFPNIVLRPSLAFGISNNSQQQEAAWAFLQQLYELELQKMISQMLFPMHISAFRERADAYVEHIASIQQIAIEAGHTPGGFVQIALEDGSIQAVFVPQMLLSDEVVDMLQDSIQQASGFYEEHFAILDIILEETLPFLHGDRTAEDTARIIQNRVQIYLSEIS